MYDIKAWVGPIVGQGSILGMNFMVPAGIRLDLTNGTLCLADEVRIRFSGRGAVYYKLVLHVKVGQYACILAGRWVDLRTIENLGHKWIAMGYIMTQGIGYR